ncbi:CAP domain-containing protein [Mesobacillus maritimus]|uniref:CAP domain-containing protein n=1 Tax=Mesobacillus maritimus TaxID=1643336 RepID=UPI00384DC377
MKKKMILTVAATAALLLGAPAINGAEAASPSYSVEKKVYVYQTGNINYDKINSYLQKYLSDYEINWESLNTNQTQDQQSNEPKEEQQPIQTPEPTAPAPEQPVQQPTAPPVQEQPAQPTKPSEGTSAPSQVSAYEQQVVDLTNQERAKQGLPALKLDIELSKVAKEKSVDMKNNGYFSHTSPNYGSPFDMMKQFGISYRTAGENIAMGQRSPEEVVNAWMNSEGHRKNILSSSYTHIGVGHVADGNYWTQMFIGK